MNGAMQTAARVGEASVKYAMAISQTIWKSWIDIFSQVELEMGINFLGYLWFDNASI